MNDDTLAAAGLAPSETASGDTAPGELPAVRWLALYDELLRGITHALSNRIATIGAAVYMLEHGDVPLAQSLESLREESNRMEVLLQQLRQLPQRPGAQAEPITVNDACAPAVLVHAHHGEWRDVMCTVEVADDVYPICVEPHGFTHALLVALTAAKRNATSGNSVRIHATGDINVVRIRVADVNAVSTDDALLAVDARCAAWLLAPSGGTARVIAAGCELEVPTLLAVRRARKG